MAKKGMTKAERKAEEERIVAEMDEAMKNPPVGNTDAPSAELPSRPAEEKKPAPASQTQPEKPAASAKPDAAYGGGREPMPRQMHCRNCGTVMENGVCPKCGYKVYVPMDEKKLRRIRWIIGGVCLAGLLIWVIVKSFK